MHEALRLDRICKTQGSRILLHDVAFHLGAGEGMALVGPSGIGKTTLLRIVAGLETADSGDVWIAGRHATRQGEILVPPHRRGIGFVFQDLALWPHMTVAQGLDFVVTSALPSLDRLERSRTISEALTLVQIGGQGDRYPHQLSGGEQQRAAFARALVHRPRLLLLDEPFSNLDAALREQMRITVTDLRAELGFAMLFVTHDRAEATAVADRTIDLAREGWTAVAPRAPRWS